MKEKCNNYTKEIGRSIYCIGNTEPSTNKGKWYIRETFTDGKIWSQHEIVYRFSLEEVVDIFNCLNEEGKITSLRGRTTAAPMSVNDACDYYWSTYENGIFSLRELQMKHRKGEDVRFQWEISAIKDMYAARDYESYKNMQRALKLVIRDILFSKLDAALKPVPESISELDLAMEEKKITIAHRILHSRIRKSLGGYDDGGYHNIRAFLINRVEQASDGILVVDLDGADALSVAKIRDRKEYLKEKYGSY